MRFRSSFTLSTKILAIFVAATLAVSVYISYAVVLSVKESTYISEKEKAAVILDSVASEIGMNFYLGLDSQSVQKARDLLAYPDVLSVSVKNASGGTMGYFSSAGANADSLKEAIKVEKIVKDSVSGKNVAQLELYYSNRNYLRLINNFEHLLVKFFVIAAVIFLLALFFIKKLLAPLSDIAERMREYIPGKNIEFARRECGDEIGSIIHSFKAMQENINSFLEEIRKKDSELMRQSKLKALMDMINAVAHNWRQPLNAIAIMLQDLELAQKYGDLDEAYLKNSVSRSMKVVNEMSKTIDDFRLFFASSGKEEEVDVGAIVAEVVHAFEGQLASQGVSIKSEGDSFGVVGQKELLRDVVSSVILNAKDAVLEKMSTDKEFHGLISIKLDSDGKKLECIDNGGGMSEEVMSRAFEPYYTTKEQGKGVGLGLFMSKTVVANMNGELTIENKDGGLCVCAVFA